MGFDVDEDLACAMYEELLLYIDDPDRLVLFPELDAIPYERVSPDVEAADDRMRVLQRLDAVAEQRTGPERDRVLSLRGRTAIANATLAYQLFRRSFAGPRWAALTAHGAHVQRPLWASTRTKNPAYRDVMYVEQLIGPDTVNTVPPATLEAFRDHGVVARTVDADVPAAERTIRHVESVGISMAAVTDQLLRDGLASFGRSYDSLLAGLDRKVHALV